MRRAVCVALLASLVAGVQLPARTAAPRAGRIAACAVPTEKLRAPRRARGAPPIREQGRATPQRELQRLSITGGEWRGRRLLTPEVYMRPMMSRVREALFSMLYPTGVLRETASILDCFSGAGTVGLEALSRGMGRATFVDFSKTCADAIRSNAEQFGAAERAHVVQADVLAVLREPARHGLSEPVDLVTITPPYEEVVYAELLDALASSPAVGEDTLALIEYPVELGVLPPVLADGRLVGLRNRRYGRTVLALYVNRPSGRLDMQPFSEEFVLQPKWEKKQARRAKHSRRKIGDAAKPVVDADDAVTT